MFSAGGAIALDARAGRRVAVATIFSGSSDGEARRREDRAAVERLGATWIDLAFPEAPARDPRLARPTRLFAPLDGEDQPLIAEVRAALSKVVAGARVCGPLAVGQHRDHQIAHRACVALGSPGGPPVSFFEDLPYALCVPLRARRLAEITGVRASGRDGGVWAIARFWAARPLLAAVAPRPLVPLAAALLAWRQTRGVSPRDLALRPERVDVSAVWDDKMAGIAAYHSQWRLFYASLEEWRSALLVEGPIERQWRSR